MPTQLQLTIQFGIRAGILQHEDIPAIERCITSRGKRAGLLKKDSPGRITDPRGFAAWQAIMSQLAISRMSEFGLIYLVGADRAAFWRFERWARYFRIWINEHLQRPFEFNLYHLHNSPAEAKGESVDVFA